MRNLIVDKCEEIAISFPYSSGEIFGLYNLIDDCRKAKNLKKYNEEEQFAELVKILRFSADAALNPSGVIDFIYSFQNEKYE